MMQSNDGEFWDQRYRAEGEIWGNSPSASAVLAAPLVPSGARVLEVGFGYGRDTVFLLRNKYTVTGIDPSKEGHRSAKNWLDREGLQVDALHLGRFEDGNFANASFDWLVCHRMAHLLVTRAGIADFARKVHQVLKPGGILSLGARNADAMNTTDMVLVDDQVYEYTHRPGHRVRFWDDATFHEAFGAAFTIESLTRSVEAESITKPIPCHLTILIARKHGPKA